MSKTFVTVRCLVFREKIEEQRHQPRRSAAPRRQIDCAGSGGCCRCRGAKRTIPTASGGIIKSPVELDGIGRDQNMLCG